MSDGERRMSRIHTLAPEDLTYRQREVHDAIVSGPRGVVRGPLAVWLHRPELADRAQALGRYCRYETTLEPRLSELAILVTARIWSSEFEWQAHKKIGLEVGLDAIVVETIRQGRRPHFTREDEAVIHDFSLALLTERRVTDELYSRATAVLGEDRLVDLTGLLGYYSLISMTINVFEVAPLDPDRLEMG